MSSSASKSAPRARDSWSGQTGFLLAAIGSAIGLGNIWRFPGVSYSNGGGAFLVPYLVALIFVGIPMLWLDYAVGHKFRGSPPWALRKIIGGGEFIGWFQTFVCFVIMVYYGAVLAWGVQYTIYSVNAAWGDDPTTFFTDTFLQVVPGDTFSWAPAWSVMIPLALVWILVLFQGNSDNIVTIVVFFQNTSMGRDSGMLCLCSHWFQRTSLFCWMGGKNIVLKMEDYELLELH